MQRYRSICVALGLVAGTNSLLSGAAASSPVAATSGASKQLINTNTGTQASKLVFLTMPAEAIAGQPLSPAVMVAVENAKGLPVASAHNQVTLRLQLNGSTAGSASTYVANTIAGVAIFNNVIAPAPGSAYHLSATSNGLTSATSAAFPVTPSPTNSFAPPAPNACESAYDQFYESEPGVYAYWAFCETGGAIPTVHDYAGTYEFDAAHQAFFGPAGASMQPAAGPVFDGETALQTNNGQIYHAQNIVINGNAGTVAVWMNMGLLQWPTLPISLSSVTGTSQIYAFGAAYQGQLCLGYNIAGKQPSEGAWVSQAQCQVQPNTWHRLVLVWSGRQITYYIDGKAVDSRTLAGAGKLFDDTPYAYNFLFGQDGSGNQVSIAKALVSNQAWSASQVSEDYAPTLVSSTPVGGVYVGSTKLGTIHRDILGYADYNSDVSSPALVSGLVTGLKTAGVTAVRFANGFEGIEADKEDWHHGSTIQCTNSAGETQQPAANVPTVDNISTYLPQVAQALKLDIAFTVNYGSNPPLCTDGGDPLVNGAELVGYTNTQNHYNIKYWEVGNEQFNGGQSSVDFHANAGKGTAYVANEPAFYTNMKTQDPGIQIGIPIGLGVDSWVGDWDIPLLSGAAYDAVIYHNYPLADPITDGATLYPERRAANVVNTRGDLLTIQTLLLNAGRSADLWITEWNADANGGGPWSRQSQGAVMPLYGVMQMAEFMRAGATYAAWQAQGLGSDCNPYYYDYQGETAYNWHDYCGGVGIAYPGPYPPGEMNVGFQPGDVMPIGRAFQILSQSGFVAEGEHMLDTETDIQNAPWLLSYGATHGNSYAVILINRDRDATHVVPVKMNGKTYGPGVTQWTYGRAQYDLSYFGDWSAGPVTRSYPAWSSVFEAVVPPWSVNVLVFE